MKHIVQIPTLKKRMSMWAMVILILLMIPFMTSAPWTGSDYIFAGTVLLGCAVVYEVLTRHMKNNRYRIIVAIGILLFIGLVIAWAATGPAYEASQLSK